jgi:hypothetical protein
VLLITGDKKRRQDKEYNCGEDSHARDSHRLWLKQSVPDDTVRHGMVTYSTADTIRTPSKIVKL